MGHEPTQIPFHDLHRNQAELSPFKSDLSRINSFDIDIFTQPKFTLFNYQEVEFVIKMAKKCSQLRIQFWSPTPLIKIL